MYSFFLPCSDVCRNLNPSPLCRRAVPGLLPLQHPQQFPLYLIPGPWNLHLQHPPQMVDDIRGSYRPFSVMPQIPRWLTTTLKTSCHLENYISVTPSTQCTRRQAFGHHMTNYAPPPQSAASGPTNTSPNSTSCHSGAKCTQSLLRFVKIPLHLGHQVNDSACPSPVKATIQPVRERAMMLIS